MIKEIKTDEFFDDILTEKGKKYSQIVVFFVII